MGDQDRHVGNNPLDWGLTCKDQQNFTVLVRKDLGNNKVVNAHTFGANKVYYNDNTETDSVMHIGDCPT